MFAAAQPRRRISVTDFIEMEQDSSPKHELVGGEIFAFAGTTVRHNDIVMNVAEHLLPAVRRQGCRINIGGVLLQVSEDTAYYPDLMVTCDDSGVGDYVISTPYFIVEVLSPSTEAVDRREKLKAYQELPSVQAYVTISQTDRHVGHHWRDERDWWHVDLVGSGTIYLAKLEVDLTVDQIYQGLDLPGVLAS